MPVAVITGASQGLGLALAHALAEPGWRSWATPGTRPLDRRLRRPSRDRAVPFPGT